MNGLSWEVLRAISEHYNLHPLAIEDIVDIPKRTKADHYRNGKLISGQIVSNFTDTERTETFCTLPLHKLVDTSPIDKAHANIHRRSVISRILGRRKNTADINQDIAKKIAEQNMMTMDEWNNPRQDVSYTNMRRSLSRYHKVVAIEQVSMFLIEDHTVISFFEISGQDVEIPIIARLSSPNTVLQENPEASLLMQAILDGIVDIVYPIVADYQKYIAELENDVLLNPSMNSTEELHILSRELGMLKHTLMPVYSLVMALKEHAIHKDVVSPQNPAGGHISNLAKLYLSDVADHVLSFTDNLDMMTHTTENLINLVSYFAET